MDMKNATYEDLGHQLVAELTAAPQVALTLTPLHAFNLLAHIQLACRHPSRPDSTDDMIHQTAIHLADQLTPNRPAVAEAIRRGWSPDHDLPASNPPANPGPTPEPTIDEITAQAEDLLRSIEHATGPRRTIHVHDLRRAGRLAQALALTADVLSDLCGTDPATTITAAAALADGMVTHLLEECLDNDRPPE